MNNIMLSVLVSGAMLLLLGIVNIYNYSVPLGENDTIMMYYDEPISEQEFDVDEEDEEEEEDVDEEDEEDDDDKD